MEERAGSGISLLFRYVGTLYVRPSGNAAAAVRLVSATGAVRDGKRGILVLLANTGNLHALLTNVRLSLTTGTEFLAPPGIEGQNILAGSRRVFFLPTDTAISGTAYDARILFDPEY